MGLAQETVQGIWNRVHQNLMQIDVDLAKADPEKHKLTLVFDGPMRWRYFDAGKDGRGWNVRFCWSTTRNAAGYFLSWREVRPPKGSSAKFVMKRDQWIARKARHRCKTMCEKRYDRFKAARAGS